MEMACDICDYPRADISSQSWRRRSGVVRFKNEAVGLGRDASLSSDQTRLIETLKLFFVS
jgi:hypothetical protein